MSYQTMHLRDEQLMLADAFEELSMLERINDALTSAAIGRLHEIFNNLMAMQEAGMGLSPAAYRELLAAIDQAKEATTMRY